MLAGDMSEPFFLPRSFRRAAMNWSTCLGGDAEDADRLDDALEMVQG